MNRSDESLRDVVRRAFAEFLTVPTVIIGGFLLLAGASYALDRAAFAGLAPLRGFLEAHVFGSPSATSDLLGTIAGGLITVTSITVSLLLVALTQSAGAMTTEVFDQFLRRRVNQVYFGTFVGLALYAVVTLATVTEGFNPVYGGVLAVLFTVVALYLLLLLLYTTINQMRPIEIIEAIHDHTLAARERQRRFIAQTRRRPEVAGGACTRIEANGHGYVTRVDLDAIARAAADAGAGVEVILLVSIGDFVAFGDGIAEVRAVTSQTAAEVGPAVVAAVHLEIQRDIVLDPAYGIAQIETIAWTSISTSKSNPAPGLLGIRSLRDLLARWAREDEGGAAGAPLPIVYTDNVTARLMDAFETLAVVSTESMQHQCFAEVALALAALFERLSPAQRARVEDLSLRIISALGEHVLTADLDAALSSLAQALAVAGRPEPADAIRAARDRMARSIGTLNSRSTRVPRVA